MPTSVIHAMLYIIISIHAMPVLNYGDRWRFIDGNYCHIKILFNLSYLSRYITMLRRLVLINSRSYGRYYDSSFRCIPIGLLPDPYNYGLRMRWECWGRFPIHRLQKKPLVNIPGSCTTRNFTYLVRGPWGCEYIEGSFVKLSFHSSGTTY